MIILALDCMLGFGLAAQKGSKWYLMMVLMTGIIWVILVFDPGSVIGTLLGESVRGFLAIPCSDLFITPVGAFALGLIVGFALGSAARSLRRS